MVLGIELMTLHHRQALCHWTAASAATLTLGNWCRSQEVKRKNRTITMKRLETSFTLIQTRSMKERTTNEKKSASKVDNMWSVSRSVLISPSKPAAALWWGSGSSQWACIYSSWGAGSILATGAKTTPFQPAAVSASFGLIQLGAAMWLQQFWAHWAPLQDGPVTLS